MHAFRHRSTEVNRVDDERRDTRHVIEDCLVFMNFSAQPAADHKML